MNYTVKNNMLIGLLVPIIIAILLFLLACVASRKLVKKLRSYSALFPLLIWAICFYTILICCGKGFIYPISYFLHSGEPEKVTLGQISEIKSGPAFPLYFDGITSSFSTGQYVIVNESSYFYPGNSLQLGKWVKLRYIDDENVICSWSELSEASNQFSLLNDSEISLISESEKKEKSPITPSTLAVIWYISFSVFLLTLVLQKTLATQIYTAVQKKDECFIDGITPSFVGIVLYGSYFLPLMGMIFCWTYKSFNGAPLVMLIALAMFIVIIIHKHSISATLEKKQLIIKRFGRSYRIDTVDISGVEWRSTAVPFCRRLVVTLSDKSQLIFEQEHFWGLNHMYDELCVAISSDD